MSTETAVDPIEAAVPHPQSLRRLCAVSMSILQEISVLHGVLHEITCTSISGGGGGGTEEFVVQGDELRASERQQLETLIKKKYALLAKLIVQWAAWWNQ